MDNMVLQLANDRLLRLREERGVTISPIHATLKPEDTESLEDILKRVTERFPAPDPRKVMSDEERDVYWKKQEELRKKRDAEQMEALYWSSTDICGLPGRYKEKTAESFKGADQIIDGVISYCKAKESLFIHGPTGSGKTHLAVAAFLKCRESRSINIRGSSPIFTTAPELLLKIRSTFNKESEHTEAEVIDTYSESCFLILDDLGAEKTSEFAITSLYLVIDRRNRDNKQTIITSNLNLKEIEEKLDARIASRLADMKIVNLSKLGDYRKRRG
jgi:DNA replication protein DnaC